MNPLLRIALIMLAAGPVSATTVLIEPIKVSQSNAGEHSIEVFPLHDQMGCSSGVTFYVRVPEAVTAASLEIRDWNGELILAASLAISEQPPEPALAPGYVPPGLRHADEVLESMQEELGFLAKGFRGPVFCISTSQLSVSSLQLTNPGKNGLTTRLWELGTLDSWAK